MVGSFVTAGGLLTPLGALTSPTSECSAALFVFQFMDVSSAENSLHEVIARRLLTSLGLASTSKEELFFLSLFPRKLILPQKSPQKNFNKSMAATSDVVFILLNRIAPALPLFSIKAQRNACV